MLGDSDLARDWVEAMRRGAFAEAWRLSDRVLAHRRRSGEWHRDAPLHLRPLWDGTKLAGRDILLRCHHGLGDSIQFVRFVPLVARIARSVRLQAQSTLLPLFAGLPGLDALMPLEAPPPPHEVAIESMELPHALRMRRATIPAEIPYLVLPHPIAPQSRADSRLQVGLAWRGGDWDPRRTLPPHALEPLVRVPGVALVNLQFGSDSAAIAENLGFAECQPASDSVLETARRIAGLDLVIAIDSMVAHLAGALGAPVWLLLHSDCDWRWMRARDRSPWYPTMRLFRQERAGDWQAPVARSARALARRARRRD